MLGLGSNKLLLLLLLLLIIIVVVIIIIIIIIISYYFEKFIINLLASLQTLTIKDSTLKRYRK